MLGMTIIMVKLIPFLLRFNYADVVGGSMCSARFRSKLQDKILNRQPHILKVKVDDEFKFESQMGI